jgi:hypothetical protein
LLTISAKLPHKVTEISKEHFSQLCERVSPLMEKLQERVTSGLYNQEQEESEQLRLSPSTTTTHNLDANAHVSLNVSATTTTTSTSITKSRATLGSHLQASGNDDNDLLPSFTWTSPLVIETQSVFSSPLATSSSSLLVTPPIDSWMTTGTSNKKSFIETCPCPSCNLDRTAAAATAVAAEALMTISNQSSSSSICEVSDPKRRRITANHNNSFYVICWKKLQESQTEHLRQAIISQLFINNDISNSSSNISCNSRGKNPHVWYHFHLYPVPTPLPIFKLARWHWSWIELQKVFKDTSPEPLN